MSTKQHVLVLDEQLYRDVVKSIVSLSLTKYENVIELLKDIINSEVSSLDKLVDKDYIKRNLSENPYKPDHDMDNVMYNHIVELFKDDKELTTTLDGLTFDKGFSKEIIMFFDNDIIPDKHVANTDCNSSLIDKFVYDIHNTALYVRFVTSDKIYKYIIPTEIFLKFACSDSLGKYYNSYIKREYESTVYTL